MRIIQLSAAQAAQVAALQNEFQAAQKAHVAAYQKMLAYLKPIAGVSAEQGRKAKLSVSDDGQHIVIQ